MNFRGLLLLAAALLASCSTREEVVYEPYDGGYPATPPLDVPSGIPIGFVSNSYSDTISVLDLATGKELRTLRVGRDPVAIDGPHHLALDRDSLVVALSYPQIGSYTGPHVAHASSTRAGYVQRISLPDLRITGEARVEENPGDIVRGEGLVLVSHFDLPRAIKAGASVDARRASLAFVDDDALSRGDAEATLVRVCAAPHAISIVGKKAYVACYAEDSVAVVDVVTKAVLSRIPLKGGAVEGAPPVVGPYSLSVDRAGTTLAVASTESKDVRLVDLASGSEVGEPVTFLGTPYFPGYSGDGRLFVPTQTPDALVVLDAATRSVLQTKDLGAACVKPHEISFSPDETRVYLVCEGDHVSPGNILILDALTLEILFSVPVGLYPDRMVLWRQP